MDKNVEMLLAAEAEVNKKVQDAMQRKNAQLKSIEREAQIALMDYRKAQDLEFQQKLEKVCHPSNILTHF